MIDVSIGAVGAALIAGLVSLLGLIVGKEQKVSEFRQAWIDDLRKCLIAYLVNINAIADAVRLQKAGKPLEVSAQTANYKMLNEASHGIKFRINQKESAAKTLLNSMSAFENLASSNESLTPDRIRLAETEFSNAASDLLKFEWNRVKQGEKIFFWTKNLVIAIVISMFLLLLYFIISAHEKNTVGTPKDADIVLVEKLKF